MYLDRSGKPEMKAKKQQEKSPFDPDNFVDFKLKKIVPYNHNTATCVSCTCGAVFIMLNFL